MLEDSGRDADRDQAGFSGPTGESASSVLHVLVVEDDPNHQFILKQAIGRIEKPIRIELASGPEEALDKVSRIEYDLALVDSRLGSATGLDLVREISSRYPGLPTMMMSSSSDPELARAAISAGALGLLAKEDILKDARKELFPLFPENEKKGKTPDVEPAPDWELLELRSRVLFTEKELREHKRLLEVVSELAAKAGDRTNTFDLCDLAVGLAIQLLEVEMGMLHLWNNEVFDLVAARGYSSRVCTLYGLVRAGEHPWLYDSMVSRERAGDQLGRLEPLEKEEGIQSRYSLPLYSGGRQLGTLTLASARFEAFPQNEIVLLERFAVHLIQVLDSAIRLEESRERERRTRIIFNESPVSIFILNAEGIVMEVNAWHLRNVIRSSMDPEEIVGSVLADHPAFQAAGLADALQGVLKGVPFSGHSAEMALDSASGELRRFNVKGLPLFDGNSKILGAILMLEDQGRVVSQADPREESGKEDVSPQDVSGDLVCRASHDLKYPIITLCGFSDLLRSEFEEGLGKQGREYVSRIRDSAETLRDIVGALVDLSVLDTRKFRMAKADLGSLARRAAESLECERVSREGRVKIREGFPHLVCASQWIREVFRQLIRNSLLYSREGIAPEIEVGCENRPLEWAFFVKDNGRGIEPKNTVRVFEPFERLGEKPRSGQVGVGLTLARRIVEAHRGRISIQSEPGQGSTVFFTLPKVDAGISGSY